MATAAPNQNLPIFYRAIEPLNVTQHGKMKVRPVLDMSEVAKTHAIPLTVDEFSLVQRHYPIVFSIGDKPIPIALMGLNENVNVFLEEDGKPIDPSLYIPAYVRRYPFLLARMRPDSDELSLCFDPTARAVGDFDEGEALFDGEQPSKATLAILEFCEQFEAAGQRTSAFMEELTKSDLLMDGEVAIQPEGYEQPFIYRGFRMVDEDKLRELRGDELRRMNQNGMLALIFAHLFSLTQMRDVFGRQMKQGKAPVPAPAAGARRRLSLFGRRRVLAADQRFAKVDGKGLDQRRDSVEAAAGRLQSRAEVAMPVDFQLKRVNAARRMGVAVDHVAAGERIVEPGRKTVPGGDRHRFPAEPAVGGAPAAIADHDLGDAGRRRRHRVAIEQ